MQVDARDIGWIPGLRKILWSRNGLLQYSCLENDMGRGAWRTTIHKVKKELDATECTQTHTSKIHKKLIKLDIKTKTNIKKEKKSKTPKSNLI